MAEHRVEQLLWVRIHGYGLLGVVVLCRRGDKRHAVLLLVHLQLHDGNQVLDRPVECERGCEVVAHEDEDQRRKGDDPTQHGRLH